MRGWPARPRVEGARGTTLSTEHRAQVVNRQWAATRLVGATSAAAARIAAAPPGYLLAVGSCDVARHGALLSPLPATNEVRAVITPGRAAGEWHLDIAARDRSGLLAAFTGVLARGGIDVVQAMVATWDDGGALEAYVVRLAGAPDAETLQQMLEASLEEPLSTNPVTDAHLTFDDEASALYTRCDVRAVDRPGLLHSVAVAVAAAAVDVHAARVTTLDGGARDRLDLSDHMGGKLGAESKDAIRAGVLGGITGLRLGRASGRRGGRADRPRATSSARTPWPPTGGSGQAVMAG